VDDLLRTIRRVLAAGPQLRLVVLFGSQATGRARAQSDIDLAILPADPELDPNIENRLATDLTWALGKQVDLVRIDKSPALLRWHIARDGVVVHADPPSLAVTFRARTASEHADLAEGLAHASARFAARLARSGR
jgi:uncharacterized protein